MKASKLIEELQKLISESGDLEVLADDDRFGDYPIEDVMILNDRNGKPFIHLT